MEGTEIKVSLIIMSITSAILIKGVQRICYLVVLLSYCYYSLKEFNQADGVLYLLTPAPPPPPPPTL